jgi:pimeloyl-ACP methyl ester carboxylesterase
MREHLPAPDEAKISEHPVSSFNLNAQGENPPISGFTTVDGPVTPPELVASPELKAELADYTEMTDPETGQKFRILELNKSIADQAPLIHALAYSISLDHAGTLHELEQIAMQHKGPIIAIENFSTGQSDNLNNEQKKQLEAKEEDNFGAVAAPILRALKAKGITEASFDGMSMGARIAASLFAHAAEHGITVDTVVLLDPPGLTDRTLRDMANRFAIQEGANQPEYQKLSTDPFQASKEPGGPLDPVKHFGKLAKKDLRANFWSYVKSMARGTAPSDIMAGLDSQPDAKVVLITGGASAIADRESANETHHDIQEAFPGRIRSKRLPGDTHAFGEGWASRVAWHISQSLAGR